MLGCGDTPSVVTSSVLQHQAQQLERAHHTAACHCPNLVLPVFFVVQLTSSLSVSTPPPRHLVSVLARLLTSATGSLLHAWLPTPARARPSRLWLRSPLCRSRLQRLSARCGDRTASVATADTMKPCWCRLVSWLAHEGRPASGSTEPCWLLVVCRCCAPTATHRCTLRFSATPSSWQREQQLRTWTSQTG